MADCRFPGCRSRLFARRLCSGHYAQDRRGRELTAIVNHRRGERRTHEVSEELVTGECAVPECHDVPQSADMDSRRARPYPAMVLCKRHATNMYSTGLSFEVWLRVVSISSCESCGRTDGRLAIDHDHSCGNHEPGKKMCDSCVRGRLCHNCNMSLGLMGDSPERLGMLAKYALDRSLTGK